MNYKLKLANTVFLSSLLILSEIGCVPNNINNTEPPSVSESISPEVDQNDNINSNNQLDNTNEPIANLENVTLDLNFARVGEKIVVNGKNFVSGKVSKVIFVNSSGVETSAKIDQVSESLLSFFVPENTDQSINLESDNDFKFHNVKIFIIQNNKRILIKEIRINITSIANDIVDPSITQTPLPTPTTSSSNNNNSSSSGGSLVQDQEGNVNVVFNPNKPVAEKGTVAGIIKDINSKTVLSNVSLKLFDLNNNELGSTTTGSDGSFSINAFVGNDYYLKVELNGKTLFNYYGVNITKDTIFNLNETIYLSQLSIGTGNLKGKVSASDLTKIVNAVIKVYTKDGLLINTSKVDNNGNYDFNVPTGNDYYFSIKKTDYTDFIYRLINIEINKTTTIENIYLLLDSLTKNNVSGTLKDTSNNNLSNAFIKIYNEQNFLIYTIISDVNGNYNISLPEGTNYYLQIIINLFIDFYYYGLNVQPGTPTQVENIYFSKKTNGTGTIKGSIKDISSQPSNNSIIKIYNNLDQLITTFRSINGDYDFKVPTGTNYHLDVIRDGYIPTRYYGINILLDQIINIQNIFIYLNSKGKGTINGKLLDSVSSQVIINAIIRVFFNGQFIGSGITDSNGIYNFDLPAESNLTLKVEKDGYKDLEEIGVNIEKDKVNNIPDLKPVNDGSNPPPASGSTNSIVFNAFVNSGDIYIMDTNGSSPINLSNSIGVNENSPNISKDGTKIAYLKPGGVDAGIYIMDSDGGNKKLLAKDSGSFFHSNPIISPDNTKILFITFNEQTNGYEINVMDIDGSNKKLIISKSRKYSSIKWSPDSLQISFILEEVRDQPNLYMVDLDGSETQITSETNDHQVHSYFNWSNDSKKLAFLKIVESKYQIHFYDFTDNSTSILTTNTNVSYKDLLFSDDDSLIYYISVDNSNNQNIKSIALTKEEGVITTDNSSKDHLFLIGGNEFIYFDNIKKEIFKVDIDGNNLKQITTNTFNEQGISISNK